MLVVIQQSDTIGSRLIGPEIIRGPDDRFAGEIGFIPESAVFRMRLSFIQASPVRRSVNELLREQILMHVQHDVESVLIRQIYVMTDLLQVFVIDDAGFRFDRIPEDPEAEEIKAHSLKVVKSLLKIRIKMIMIAVPLQDIDSLQDDFFTAFVDKPCSFRVQTFHDFILLFSDFFL